ncbi:RDD family protein [Streptomyces azureus]|uniref:Membrane protein n=1 Tax=Streptomyces azureus TaxID=146537 RepID=A0A0K8PT24_STRAJ|nr:RDD family protein [Streptomyces azureus]GAP50941.1 membrane protein [Streptomyces azureus]
MSAPTPAPGDDRPREGYYPDPSIPGYVRYWNGASWVPGTSRPAPKDGETLAPPPGAGTEQPGASGSAAASASASVEETGPHFFDEDPADEPSPADAQHGSRPEPATAWGADRSRQSGFGGDQDRRVSWGAPQGAQGADPRVSHADRQPADESAAQGEPPSPADQEANAAAAGSTFVFRRPTGKTGGGASADAPDEGTMTFRAVSPRPGTAASAGGSEPAGGPGGNSGTPGFGPSGPGGSGSGQAASGFGAQAGPGGSGADSAGSGFGSQGAVAGFGSAGSAGPAGSGFGAPAGPAGSPAGPAFGAQGGAAASADASNRPGFSAGKAAAARAAAQADPGVQASAAAPAALSGPQSAPTVPPQSGGPQPGPAASATPLSAGPGGGQSSWAQQVHRLAGAGGGDDQPVAPWKPPTEDIFQAAARRQASARPAGLGKRLAARLLDTLVLAVITAGAAVPLGIKAVDHVNEKIEEARLSGETVTVWLLDGTTSVYLGIVLAVLLLVGVVSEVLPTAKWGRTLGKKLMGLEVRDIEGHDAPEFGAALRRWLVYSVPGLLVVGIVGIAWCLFDKPWRQCWHDKAAHTFVAG